MSKIENILEVFKRLDSRELNPVLFWSKNEDGWKRRLAWNPRAVFFASQNEKEKIKDFLIQNAGSFIAGFLSYDEGNSEFPQNCFFVYDSFWEEGMDANAEILQIMKREPKLANYDLQLKSKVSFESYAEAFEKAQKYIKAGHIYQMNLTIPFESRTELDSKVLFLHLLKQNPVNFMCYFEIDTARAILSASPERFIHTNGSLIQTYPIKGTRPRGSNPEEDELERQALLDSEKEASELNMITDLLRNDIGKIAKTGSVKLKAHRVAKAYPAIWHTYSHICAELKVSPIEALFSMFPGGSITGCPKKRAIEIIAELETYKRGIYTGSIGFIEPNGDLDFNIAIRSLLKSKDFVTLNVGGGLVFDSKLESEWEEIFNKAKPFIRES